MPPVFCGVWPFDATLRGEFCHVSEREWLFVIGFSRFGNRKFGVHRRFTGDGVSGAFVSVSALADQRKLPMPFFIVATSTGCLAAPEVFRRKAFVSDDNALFSDVLVPLT